MNDIYKKHHNDKPEKEMSRSFLESIGFEKQDKSQRYVGYLGDYYVFEKCVWKRGYGTGINPLHLMHASKTDHLYMFTQIKYHDESEDTDMTCFSGTIDNETDFKRLLKQIGVEL
jgi:hypothetical protein